MNDKIILTDCDGVMLSWEDQFHNWMNFRGHNRIDSSSYWLEHHYVGMSEDEAKRAVEEYNGSSWMLGLPPMRDARVGVARLVDAGYKFHVITAMGINPYAIELREQNLKNVFGADAVAELTVVGLDESKYEALEPYKDSGLYWIEDKASNARLGAELGLNSILLSHLYNEESDKEGLTVVDNWHEICELIIDTD